MSNDEKIFYELALIHTEILMLEKILLKDVPFDYGLALNDKITVQTDVLEALLKNLKENGGDVNG